MASSATPSLCYSFLLFLLTLDVTVQFASAQGNLITPTSPCEQSSTRTRPADGSRPALTLNCGRAIDGDDTTFSHTTNDPPNQWWMVDLGQPYCIGSVYIKNLDNNQERLGNISIRISMTADIKPALDSPVWEDVRLNGRNIGVSSNLTVLTATRARFVAIINTQPAGNDASNSRFLNLPDVRVYENLDGCSDSGLLSSSSACRQSPPNNPSNTCDKALDGDDSTISHSVADTSNKWWMVDLGASYCINKVLITNRPSHFHRLNSISILTSITATINDDPDLESSMWRKDFYQGPAFGEEADIRFPSTRARFVAIFHSNSGNTADLRILNMPEVQVYEDTVSLCPDPEERESLVNLSSPCQQSSTAVDGPELGCGLALDRNKTTYSQTPGPVTGEPTPQWWMVDLGDTYCINNVLISNRRDRKDRLNSLSIKTATTNVSTGSIDSSSSSSPSIWQEVFSQESGMFGPEADIWFPTTRARYVAILNSNPDSDLGILNMAEVRIFKDSHAICSDPWNGNLALHKPTYNSTGSDLVVDGVLDNSPVNEITGGRWTVDLMTQYYITEVVVYSGGSVNTVDIEIQIQNGTGSGNRAPGNEWKNCRSTTIGSQETHILCSDRRQIARYVSLSAPAAGGGYHPLEIVIYGARIANAALSRTASQSTVYDNDNTHPAGNANDGNLGPDISRTAEQRNQWWKVDLGSMKYVKLIRIFNRAENRAADASTSNNQLNKVTVLTTEDNPINSPAAPTSVASRWSLCYYQEEAMGDITDVTCAAGTIKRARQVAILVGGEFGVTLREVEIYTLEPGELTGSLTANVIVSHQTETSADVTFPAWNNGMPGDIAPNRYEVFGPNRVYISTFSHPTSRDDHIVMSIGNISPGACETFTINSLPDASPAAADASFTACAKNDSYTDGNLALYKPVYSSAGIQNASLAVDGRIDTSTTGITWLTVNLADEYYISQIVIVTPPGTNQKFTIKTTTHEIQERESKEPDSAGSWTECHPLIVTDGRTQTECSQPRSTARYVSVESTPDFQLRQFAIYGARVENVARRGNASQSTTYKNGDTQYLASKAIDGIDGIDGTFSHTEEFSDQWWKVDLASLKYVKLIRVYNRDGSCSSGQCGERLNQVSILTTMTETAVQPSNPPTADWSLCYYQKSAFSSITDVSCINAAYQKARQVAVLVGASMGVALKELQVYTLEPGRLSPGLKPVVTQRIDNLVFTIPKWNNSMTGDVPPTSYKIYQNGGQIETYTHNPVNTVVSITASNPQTGTEYQFSVTSFTDGFPEPDHADFTFDLCLDSAPPNPTVIINRETLDEAANKVKVKLGITGADTCPAIANLTITYKPGTNSFVNTTKLYPHPSFEFTVDPYTQVLVRVSATNVRGLRSETTLPTFTSVQGVPEAPASLTLTEVERTGNEQRSCLKLEWPESPNLRGVFKAYQYECNHTGSSGTKNNTHERMVKVCGLPAGESIRCTIKVENDVKTSALTSATGTTICRNPETDGGDADITIGTQQVVDDGTRGSLIRLTVSWPAFRSNCLGAVSYKVTAQIQTGAQQPIERPGLTGTSVTLERLYAYTGYTVTLTVTNSKSNKTMLSKDVTTRPTAPFNKVRNLTLEAAGGSGVLELSWLPPLFPNGDVQYHYDCTIKDSSNGNERNSSDTAGLSTTLTDLEPGLGVNCTVFAFNLNGGRLKGPSSSVFKQVECSDPAIITQFDEPKEMENVYDERPYLDVEITWTAPNAFCSSIANYTVSAKSLLNEGPLPEPVTTQTANVTLEKVRAYSNVTVTVVTVNNKGFFSRSMYNFTSSQLKPYGLPKITGNTTTTSCVSLSWNPPEWTNGPIISHTVQCEPVGGTPKTSVVDRETYETELCKFDSATAITCTIFSTNAINNSEAARATLVTEINVTKEVILEPPEGFVISQPYESDDLTFPISVKPFVPTNENITFKFYQIDVVILETESQLVADQGTRRRRDASSNQYIAAKFDAQKVDNGSLNFLLGDGTQTKYEGRTYSNLPLEPNKKYNVSYSAGLIIAGIMKMVGTSPLQITVAKTTQPPSQTATIIAVCVAVVAVAIIAIVVVVMIRRRGGLLRRKRDTNEDVELYNAPRPNGDGAAARDSSRNSGGYEQVSTQAVSSIPVKTFSDYLKANIEKIKSEYDDFAKLPTYDMKAAARPENKGKSKYQKIYPVDEFRVKLVQAETSSGTDFINASHISCSFGGGDYYIAAQGPMNTTIEDFILMMWQKHPCAVVMLTQCVEAGKLKCEQYWPDSQSADRSFRDIKVHLVSTDTWADYVVRVLELKRGEESRVIRQFHFISWPDHGVPEHAAFSLFYYRVKREVQQLAAPLLIHCSAGVGRTGTFIALDHLLDEAEKSKRVDPYQSVVNMRRRRPFMIQTKEQYVFLHEVLSMSLTSRRFTCDTNQLDQKLRDADRPDSIIKQEYLLLEELVANAPIKYSAGGLDENMTKNRDQSVLPNEAYRPFINSADGDYINAVCIDGYRFKDQYIITQLPLKKTVQDFWRLIVDSDVRLIVQLETSETPFFPNTTAVKGSTMSLFSGESRLKCTDIENNKFNKTTTLKVTVPKKEEKTILVVSVLDADDVISKPAAMLEIFEEMDRCQRKLGEKKTCFTCMNGARLSGFFLCAYSALDRVKVEPEADIFKPTMICKYRRPQFISREADYKRIYSILVEYVNQFSEYSNFA